MTERPASRAPIGHGGRILSAGISATALLGLMAWMGASVDGPGSAPPPPTPPSTTASAAPALDSVPPEPEPAAATPTPTSAASIAIEPAPAPVLAPVDTTAAPEAAADATTAASS